MLCLFPPKNGADATERDSGKCQQHLSARESIIAVMLVWWHGGKLLMQTATQLRPGPGVQAIPATRLKAGEQGFDAALLPDEPQRAAHRQR
uniref:Uncharacterized protein n=1 Tax=Thermogemmatispora argillosa TaxID=2045280 RepID=A0A455T8V4_9CHLR|nr:hypothetical protein KTA_40920 [Thermogemmatispora argillosa]